MPAITINDLGFQYREGSFSLDIPNLVFDDGESVAIVGPSGSGKTTLLHLIAGIVTPRRGEIHVGGERVSHLSEADRRAFRIRRLGLVFQAFELLEYLSVLDNILLPYRIGPGLVLDRAARSCAIALADQVGLGDKLSRLATRLSQGERQRVAICRALLPEPRLLLADEPTGNLDPVNKETVLDSLFDCAGTAGATLLAVTHDRDVLGRFDRVIDFKTFLAPPGANTS